MGNSLKKAVLLLILSATALFSTLPLLGQTTPYINKSSRPSSLKFVLPGISYYSFEDDFLPDELRFVEAYFVEEIKKWIETVRPGISFGTNYARPMTEHLRVSFAFQTRPYLSRNGAWRWNTSDIRVSFRVEGLDYEYVYSLPNISVQGNNFNDHILYNNLLKYVNGFIYQFDRKQTLRLADYRSGWNESSIKSSFQADGCELFEGIYEDIASDNGHKNNKYKLAMKYIDGKPCLIYLGGAWLYDDWKEGEYKAWLEPTATPNIFKAQWLMSNKEVSSAYVSFENGAMHTSNTTTNENDTFIKLYPTASDDIIVAGNKSSVWSGSGFALNNGYIVTNYHVIDGAKSIEVHGVKGDSSSDYSAKIVAVDKTNDLAIIQINDSRFNGFGSIPYSIKSQTIDVGENVWVLGYPLTQVLGNEIKLTNGVVSSRSGYQGDVSTYQISAPVQPGNSGGPLFDSKGNIVGIINAGVPGAENVGYAIKTTYLKNLADSHSLSSYFPVNNSISSLPLKSQVKSVSNFVFLLICSSKSDHSNSSKATGVSDSYAAPSNPSSNSISRNPNNSNSTAGSSHSVNKTTINGVKTVFNPENGNANYIYISKVELSSSNTSVYFHYENKYGSNGINVSQNTYICGPNGIHKQLINARNIPISPEKHLFSKIGETVDFVLEFPSLNLWAGIKYFDIIDPDNHLCTFRNIIIN